MKKRLFLKSAAVIAAGGFVAKVIGALYRIPLASLIGSHGIGLYQVVYPFYCLLLTVSATGIPSPIAKLTAECRAQGLSSEPLFKSAMFLFSCIGGVGSLLMCLLAPLLSRAQGCGELTGGYFALAPAVFLVSAISVFRGWFQGRNNMFPTALSEIAEQVVKAALGLLFAYLYRENVRKAVFFILLSVSVSELFALALLFFLYRRTSEPFGGINDGGRVSMKTILGLSVPVTLSSALLPFSSMLDSVIIVRLLSGYTEDAVALYGLFSGGAVTLVNLPVSLCYGVAAAIVPAVSASKAGEGESGNAKEPRRRMLFALSATALLSAPCAAGLYLFAPFAVRTLFSSLGAGEAAALVRLVRLYAVSAVTLSCVQTLSACLTGLGKPKYAAFSMAAAVAVKTASELLLVSRPEISVYGAAIAADVCYFVAFFLDLLYNLRETRAKRPKNEPTQGAEGIRGGSAKAQPVQD